MIVDDLNAKHETANDKRATGGPVRSRVSIKRICHPVVSVKLCFGDMFYGRIGRGGGAR